MNVLAFDTCFLACSVAVRAERPGQPPREADAFRAMETGHAEALMPMVEAVMAEAGVAFSDLQRIVVTHGPGTFTGVRTGVSAARALALATGAGIVGVSSLWPIAVEAIAAAGAPPPFDAVMAVMDARKGQFYVQIVDRIGAELTAPMLADASTSLTLCPGRQLAVTGNAASAVIEASQGTDRKLTFAGGRPGGQTLVGHSAIHLLAAALRSSIAGPLIPLYLRPPDAKPQADKSLPWSST